MHCHPDDNGSGFVGAQMSPQEGGERSFGGIHVIMNRPIYVMTVIKISFACMPVIIQYVSLCQVQLFVKNFNGIFEIIKSQLFIDLLKLKKNGFDDGQDLRGYCVNTDSLRRYYAILVTV
jgi:hypothetical protein